MLKDDVDQGEAICVVLSDHYKGSCKDFGQNCLKIIS